ncbi:MAG: GspE/PulE family protein [Tissierellia bacterium]|nr:GspE/PulE family protein [Tissierellia bacterium]
MKKEGQEKNSEEVRGPFQNFFLDKKGAPPQPPQEGSGAVHLLREILAFASQEECSDVHIEGQEKSLRIRLRKNGQLFTYKVLDKGLQQSLVARIKVLSHLDIAEKRQAQDGRFSFDSGAKTIDVRVSILPTVYGEKVVLRLLNSVSLDYSVEGIGLRDQDLKKIQLLLRQPSGLILLCGPTGCGKTSTLYTMIQMLNDEKRNIVTIEDPVEYKIGGVNQIAVNDKTGLSFEAGLKAILRQDPEVIMVGEIRSYDTAETALRASMTGHLVLSTLHTIDSPSALVRLQDMRLAPYMISSGLTGIVSQRLVRRLCPKCKEAVEGEDPYFHLEGAKIYEARGCPDCLEGYTHRQAIFEILILDQKIKSLVLEGASLEDLRAHARHLKMASLYDQVRDLLLKGDIDLEEAYRSIASI